MERLIPKPVRSDRLPVSPDTGIVLDGRHPTTNPLVVGKTRAGLRVGRIKPVWKSKDPDPILRAREEMEMVSGGWR